MTSYKGTYRTQKNNAKRRSISWGLTYIQWRMIWARSGHWCERGRGRNKFVMARFDDKGPYAPWNVKICTVEENNKEINWSEEIRTKMSKSHLGKKNHMWGRKHSKETRARISQTHLGMKHSSETQAKMSKSHRGMKHSPKTRHKISQSQRGKGNSFWNRNHTLATRAKMSESHIANWKRRKEKNLAEEV